MADENRNALTPRNSEGNPASTLSDANRTEPATGGTSILSGHDERRRQKEQRAEEPVQAAARPGMISERKLQANRTNAKKSTGPRTAGARHSVAAMLRSTGCVPKQLYSASTESPSTRTSALYWRLSEKSMARTRCAPTPWCKPLWSSAHISAERQNWRRAVSRILWMIPVLK